MGQARVQPGTQQLWEGSCRSLPSQCPALSSPGVPWMILPRAAAKNYHGRELFQWSLNLEHPLNLLQVVLDTWCCSGLCFVSVWLLQAHSSAFPFRCRACPKPSQTQTKRVWAKAVWGKFSGEKWMMMRLSCWGQERKESYGHKEFRLCSVAKYSHIQHIGMQRELRIEAHSEAEARKGVLVLWCRNTLALGNPVWILRYGVCHVTYFRVDNQLHGTVSEMDRMKQESEMTQLCNIVRVILDWLLREKTQRCLAIMLK